MAKKGNRIKIKLKSTKSGHCYYTTKNRINTQDKIKITKFDPTIKKHVEYEESKIKNKK
ncbi:50S ribosomal protein L33 [Candidatus Dojkabacteria bacterium]|nr:50S ribosomal protein L33 [Candidatus Dojkabacteria bacterium]